MMCFLVKPGERRIESFDIRTFAHRGYHDENAPENSLTAFENAKRLGHGVELDVQLTLDEHLVVFHDQDLERMCGVSRNIGDLTYEELLEYKLKGSNEKIPLFEDVLAILEDRPIICEIKTQKGVTDVRACKPVCEAIDLYKGPVYVESFSPFVVQWFRLNRPDIIRGQLSMDFMKNRTISPVNAFVMKNLLIHCFSRPDFIAYRQGDNSVGLKLIKKLFNPLYVIWTVQSEEEYELITNDVHGVIFENIALMPK